MRAVPCVKLDSGGRKPAGRGGFPGSCFPFCAEVSRRLEELARPKRFYSEYYNNNRYGAAGQGPLSVGACRGGPRSWDQETHSHRPDTEPLKLSSPDRTQEALRAAGQVLVSLWAAGGCETDGFRRLPPGTTLSQFLRLPRLLTWGPVLLDTDWFPISRTCGKENMPESPTHPC